MWIPAFCTSLAGGLCRTTALFRHLVMGSRTVIHGSRTFSAILPTERATVGKPGAGSGKKEGFSTVVHGSPE